MEEEKKEHQEKKGEKEREELADKVLDIFSDRPDEMNSLVELLKSLEGIPALHPEKQEPKPEKKEDKEGAAE